VAAHRGDGGMVVVIKPGKKKMLVSKKKKSIVKNIPGAQTTLVVVWALCVRLFVVARFQAGWHVHQGRGRARRGRCVAHVGVGVGGVVPIGVVCVVN
jgi:hypothetical protein